jgi:hypothetical protein
VPYVKIITVLHQLIRAKYAFQIAQIVQTILVYRAMILLYLSTKNVNLALGMYINAWIAKIYINAKFV